MALYVDDLDRVITIDDVPTIYNGVYSTSVEELLCFCQSAHIDSSLIILNPNVTHSMAYMLKKKREWIKRFGGNIVEFGRSSWVRDELDWD
jgi:hypothetical protein